MNTQRVANTLALTAELSHIFCCGIPMLVAALTTAGQITGLGVLVGFHDAIHDYEIMVLVGSAVLLLLALGLQYISFKLDCRDSGCTHKHADCTPQKFKASKMLMLASAIFTLNVILFFTLDHDVHHHDQHGHDEHGHSAHEAGEYEHNEQAHQAHNHEADQHTESLHHDI